MTAIVAKPVFYNRSLSSDSGSPFRNRIEKAVYRIAREMGESGHFSIRKKNNEYLVFLNGKQVTSFATKKSKKTIKDSITGVAQDVLHFARKSFSPTVSDLTQDLAEEMSNYRRLEKKKSKILERQSSKNSDIPKPLSEKWYGRHVAVASLTAGVISLVKGSTELFLEGSTVVTGLSYFKNIFKIGSGSLLYKKAKLDKVHAKEVEDQDAATQSAIFETSAKATILQGTLSLCEKVLQKLNVHILVDLLKRIVIFLGAYKVTIGLGKAIYRLRQARILKKEFKDILKNEKLSEQQRYSGVLTLLDEKLSKKDELSKLYRYTDSETIIYLQDNLQTALDDLKTGSLDKAKELLAHGFINEINRRIIKEEATLLLGAFSATVFALTIFATAIISSVALSVLSLISIMASMIVNSQQIERLLPPRQIKPATA